MACEPLFVSEDPILLARLRAKGVTIKIYR